LSAIFIAVLSFAEKNQPELLVSKTNPGRKGESRPKDSRLGKYKSGVAALGVKND